MNQVHIINTGVANIRSLQVLFERSGVDWKLTTDPNQVESASHCVLPGVGTFGAALQMLDRTQIRQAIIDRIGNDSPTLCICLGLQLLCTSSDETPGAEGLNVVPEKIRQFDDTVQVPQLGWNDVVPQSDGPFPKGQAYFANSYRLVEPPVGWSYATTQYGGDFVSSFWRGQVLACQFHPELSGAWGGELVKNWIEGTTLKNPSGANRC